MSDGVERVLERVAAWPARADAWWAVDWPFDAGSQARALVAPWLVGVAQQQWLAEYGGPAVLLALELKLSPQLLDRVLGDLCRRPPVIDRFRCLGAGPATPAREALWERLKNELPGAVAVLMRLAATPVAIGPNGEGYRQGYIAGAWEEYWRAGQERRGSAATQVLEQIAREGMEHAGARRWLKGYRACVDSARHALGWEQKQWTISRRATRPSSPRRNSSK